MASCLAIRSLVVWQFCIFFIPLQRGDASYNQRSIAAELSTSRTHTHTHTCTHTRRRKKRFDIWQHWLSNLKNVSTCTCNLLSASHRGLRRRKRSNMCLHCSIAAASSVKHFEAFVQKAAQCVAAEGALFSLSTISSSSSPDNLIDAAFPVLLPVVASVVTSVRLPLLPPKDHPSPPPHPCLPQPPSVLQPSLPPPSLPPPP